MRVLITGAAGWLARHLVEALAQTGHEMRLMDRVDPDEATIFVPGKIERLAAPLRPDWPYVKGAIGDLDTMRSACDGMDAVIHLAALTDGLPEHGRRIMDVNVVGTYVVLDAARLQGVRRVLCASSINAFGTFAWRLSGKPPEYDSLPLDESFNPVPEDPYSLSKYCGEHICAAFHRAYGMTAVALRFAGVLNDELYDGLRRAAAPTQAWADDLYQWVHYLDVVRGVRQALECETLPGLGVYTLGAADTRCPEPTMELIKRFRPDLLAALTCPLPGRSALLSIRRAQNDFDYDPTHRINT